tara:strand:+ start:178 stop:657 length:480 start_codon:yes stop_codon:yes gene_type:complete
MKYLIILIFFSIKNISAFELSCLFEEVHLNGDTQQGVLIIKDKKFRYQYFSNNLYTIIHKKNSFFYIENRDKTKFYKISKDTDVLEAIVEIINDYPDIKEEYFLKDSLIKVEYSNTERILKRIIVLSEQLKMSVYLKECKEIPLKDFYFSWSPFWEFKY